MGDRCSKLETAADLPCSKCEMSPTQVLSMFDFQAGSGLGDQVAGIENDLGNASINTRVLRRVTDIDLAPDEEQALGELFNRINLDSDDTITEVELRRYFSKYRKMIRPDELEELMEIADKDGNGQLNKEEFLFLAKRILLAAR
eukprot:TRINITY_DN46764_c0_g1_i1.p2 TRINITY_DN46764_c0_g1~~TRINITY_DN46764_c0_g1_i1.p2  ORF type:complete len:144 (-),score=47.56 TRINITY_DN46764_c0_g1_i1:86-517(-)